MAGRFQEPGMVCRNRRAEPARSRPAETECPGIAAAGAESGINNPCCAGHATGKQPGPAGGAPPAERGFSPAQRRGPAAAAA